MNNGHRIYKTPVADVYSLYVAKVERKGRAKDELNRVIRWLTGYSQQQLEQALQDQVSFEEFFEKAPRLNPNRSLITGVICGIRIEDITESLMKEIRYLDKLVDELAKGRPMAKILRVEA